jgi:hypothetical protein
VDNLPALLWQGELYWHEGMVLKMQVPRKKARAAQCVRHAHGVWVMQGLFISLFLFCYQVY